MVGIITRIFSLFAKKGLSKGIGLTSPHKKGAQLKGIESTQSEKKKYRIEKTTTNTRKIRVSSMARFDPGTMCLLLGLHLPTFALTN